MSRSAARLVLGAALVLPGCASVDAPPEAPRATVREAPRPAPPVPPPPRPVVPPPAVRPEPGSFTVERGQPGLVIGAPHGTSDIATDRMGQDLARRTGWSAVIARGFSGRGPGGPRLHVNRPTESAPGASAASEIESGDARQVYEAYAAHVAAAAQGPLRLYVEVHGNAHEESAARIEIATVGVDRDAAWRLRTLLELIRDTHLDGSAARDAGGERLRLEVLVEPLDRIHYTASAAKARGLLRTVPCALHIELPRAARTTHREVYTAVLADFLVQAAAVVVGGRGSRPPDAPQDRIVGGRGSRSPDAPQDRVVGGHGSPPVAVPSR